MLPPLQQPQHTRSMTLLPPLSRFLNDLQIYLILFPNEVLAGIPPYNL